MFSLRRTSRYFFTNQGERTQGVLYSSLVLCCFMLSLFHARWWSSSSRERIDDTHEVFFGVMYLGCSGHFLSFSLSCLVVVVHNGLAAVLRTAFLVHLPEKCLEHCSARQTHTHKKKKKNRCASVLVCFEYIYA